VPIAAWCGIFIADLLVRRGPYSESEFYDPRGRYGSVQLMPIGLLIVATGIGWGLVTNTLGAADWLNWQGYLLGPFGLGGKTGAWEYANLGVFAALAIGFVGQLFVSSSRREQPIPAESQQMEHV
jgi:hypothetical protein